MARRTETIFHNLWNEDLVIQTNDVEIHITRNHCGSDCVGKVIIEVIEKKYVTPCLYFDWFAWQEQFLPQS